MSFSIEDLSGTDEANNKARLLTLVTTYFPNNTKILPIILSRIPILQQSSIVKSCLPKHAVIKWTAQEP